VKKRLLPALIEWRKDKKGCVFHTEASINLADDPELLDLTARAGFDSVFIGIESPDENSLTECRKNQNKNRDLLQNVKIIQHSGLQVTAGFIVGFDSDTPSTFRRQIDFIQKSGIVTAMVGILNAPMGTRLFDRLQREDRLVAKVSGDNVDGTTNIIPKARGVATQRISEAEGYALERVNRAQGEATRFEAILGEYQGAPQVTRRRLYLEAMTGLLSDMKALYIVDRDQQAMVPWLPLESGSSHQQKGGSHEVYLESGDHRHISGYPYRNL
jgi:radical SAM superfamily enzyme YgiQ (UPF0313 family)